MLLEEIVEDDAEAELLESREIDGDRFGALSAIAPGYIGRDGAAISDDPIDNAMRDVLLNGAQMVREGVTGGFAGCVIKLAIYTREARDLAIAPAISESTDSEECWCRANRAREESSRLP